MLIVVNVSDEPNETYMANARTCSMRSDNNRPTLGAIMFNLAHMNHDTLNLNTLLKIILHETLHIIGFSGNLYSYFPVKNNEF